ncbi:MAG: hypothetical protein BJ554DRAFT_2431 [Olpidium bornovanus]|uniref:Uncharacterized protein n=1 Tax=Olpidium bornovanus TaxID=278681 RepID=A0A8H7ZQ97_9FUNG|nr:MAG: hypothetical protein BJ554DRAFT_2431 [Olpidium bornovanus]
MDFLFGAKKTPAELLRQHQRALTKAQRDLDRERANLERQEKKVIADIKKAAKAGQMVRILLASRLLRYDCDSDVQRLLTDVWWRSQNACKVMAKDLVRSRRYIQKFYNMKTQLQAVSLRIQVEPADGGSNEGCDKGNIGVGFILRVIVNKHILKWKGKKKLHSNRQ